MTRVMVKGEQRNHCKHENGVHLTDLATQFGVAKSAICTITKIKICSREPLFQEE